MTISTKQQLEKLLLSDDFTDLAAKVSKFNVFNVLKLENAEIRHSNFLGWLLSPHQNHLLRDDFLKELFLIILKNYSNNQDISTSISDIIFNDFSDAQITLEKMTDESRRIDIFIESKRNDFVCVIENKIWSGEGCNQLEDYEKYINSHEKYGSYKHKLFIFLTPNKIYDGTKLYKNYIRIDYGDICRALDNILKKECGIVLDEVRHFIENYKEMVERDIMGKYDNETLELCSKIYNKYGNVIDLIMQKGNPKAQVMSILEEILQERTDLIDIRQEKNGFLFLPDNINNKDKFNLNDCDTKNVVNLFCWGYAWGKKGFFLEILVGAGKDKFQISSPERTSLIEHIETKMKKTVSNIHFIQTNEEYSPSREGNELYNILTPDELASCNNRDKIKEKLIENLEKSGYIENIREALNSWNYN